MCMPVSGGHSSPVACHYYPVTDRLCNLIRNSAIWFFVISSASSSTLFELHSAKDCSRVAIGNFHLTVRWCSLLRAALPQIELMLPCMSTNLRHLIRLLLSLTLGRPPTAFLAPICRSTGPLICLLAASSLCWSISVNCRINCDYRF